MTRTPASGKNVQLTGPFDSLRDYVAALEARGRLIRIKEMDQDKYETTAFAYRIIDEYGYYSAPTFLVERIKQGGKWYNNPLIGNPYGGWDTEAMGFGVEPLTDDWRAMYRAAMQKVKSLADEHGEWKRLKPNELDKNDAPCKECIHIGDDVDIEQYGFIQSNPADAGRYINMGSTVIQDPKYGRNVGTYRCQIKGPRKIGVNPEPGQNAWNIIMASRRGGQDKIKAAIVVGADPITWAMSSSKAAAPGVDELELAGGFRGKPLDVVKCETSDILVPAHAEMVIEGEIPSDMEEEGPFGEMYGYLGLKKDKNFIMNIQAISHRKDPWIPNSYTGVTRGFLTAPVEASLYYNLKRTIYNLQAIHMPTHVTGFVIVSIDKRMGGDGIAAGAQVAGFLSLAKITIVVDKDVDVYNFDDVMRAVGARWQPSEASLIMNKTRGMRLDPSQTERGLSSKIVIDATRKLPAEGGPDEYPKLNRQWLEELSPDSFDLVDRQWSDYIKDFKG